METELLETMFGRMGARVKVRELTRLGQRPGVDIRTDKRGEYFDIGVLLHNPGERTSIKRRVKRVKSRLRRRNRVKLQER